MGGRVHDVLVVGGGVCGLCIARDAAMRGLSVALVERDDFAHATSAASSKLIHGGLRYLKNFELSLVRESLRERRTWEVIAPHLVYPLPFLFPIYKRRKATKKWMVRAGLTLYDLLAYDRNRLEDEARKLPGHESLSAEEALARVPGLDPEGLVGALQYWDCQMFAPERLALECGIDAAARGAQLANYTAVDSFLLDGDRVRGAKVRDALSGDEVEIEAKAVVNATGPWADRLLSDLPGHKAPPVVRSKGIHIITRDLTGDLAVAFEGRHGHFFILPWRGHSIIGTTDVLYEGEPDAFGVTEKDIEDFLAVIGEGFPSAALTRDDVVHFYGGMRPLVESAPGDDSYSASRRSEVVDHAEDGGPSGLFSALGGKWTTARAVAEQVVDNVAASLRADVGECETHKTPLPGGGITGWDAFLSARKREHADLDPDVVEHLAVNYGVRMRDVLRLTEDDPGLLEPVAEGRKERRAEVVLAVRDEMARTLADVVFRRTGLGTLGNPGDAALETTADLMAAELDWSADERARQLAEVRLRFTPVTA